MANQLCNLKVINVLSDVTGKQSVSSPQTINELQDNVQMNKGSIMSQTQKLVQGM